MTFLLVLLFVATPATQTTDPAARSQAATRAMTAGRFDEAAQIYRELLQTLPDDAGLLTNLGMALAMGGHEADALAPLERALTLKPELLPARLFLGSSYLALGQPEKAIAPLERVVAARPGDVDNRRMLARAYTEAGRVIDAVTQLRRVTELAPTVPVGWYALGHAYNEVTQDAMSSFVEASDEPWRQLLVADALFADKRFIDAFAMYQSSLEQLPTMATIHDSIARIYERTGHADWAASARKRAAAYPVDCTIRKPLCEFRAARYRTALAEALRRSDAESRYWRARAATELALAAFKRLDGLPDSRERREVRATLARSERRYVDAIAELKVALKFAPGDPDLLDDLGTSYYFARDYDNAVTTLAPLVKSDPQDARLLTVYGDSLLQLQRLDEAIAILQRAVKLAEAESLPRLTLGRAYIQQGNFAAAIPLIEGQLDQDDDGTLHLQLARAYTRTGQDGKAAALLERSQQLQRAAQERNDRAAQRAITPPK